MAEEKSIDQKVMQLFAEGKISQECAKELLMQNSQANSNQRVQPQKNPISQTENKNGFKVWPWMLLGLGVLGYFTYKNNPNLINQIKNFGIYQNQGQQTPTQNQIQSYSPQPVQQVEQEQMQEETIKRDTVGFNMWATSNNLNYSFKVTGKKLFDFCMYDLQARHSSNLKNMEWMQNEYFRILLLEIKAIGKNGETRLAPLGFSLQTNITSTNSLLEDAGGNYHHIDSDSKTITEILRERGYNLSDVMVSTDQYNEVKFYLPFYVQNSTTLKYKDDKAVPAELLYLINIEDENAGVISIGKPED